ncbi:MAG: fatty acid desaturase [Oligoflexia bacterium]|nr:fatty acid desaturase [Oligoflexia bacterium]
MRKIDWVNTTFLVGTPIAAAIFTPIHIYLNGLNWKVLVFFLIYSVMTSMSITGGYHRLFAHRSYEARWGVKLFYLLFGAAALQNSALKWCTDHRRHHRHVDTETDPYSINKGFFYAHIGWIFFKEDAAHKGKFAPDLEKDTLVYLQNKYYLPIAVFMGFGFPTLIGWALGSPFGGLVFGGLVRTVLTQHCTFLINSFCHMFGKQPYSDKTSARDSFLLALFTYGEGYHNFHHEFQADYRNGIRWYHWDPTKWAIRLLSFFGLTHRLKRVREEEILKAKLRMGEKTLTALVSANLPIVTGLRIKVETSQERMHRLHAEYIRAKKDFTNHSQERFIQLKAEMKMAKLEFKMAYAQWKTYMKMLRNLNAA